MAAERRPDTADKRDPADLFLNNVVLPTPLTSVLGETRKRLSE